MKQYIVKVTTGSGYILFTEEAVTSEIARLRTVDKMKSAGWNPKKIEVVE